MAGGGRPCGRADARAWRECEELRRVGEEIARTSRDGMTTDDAARMGAFVEVVHALGVGRGGRVGQGGSGRAGRAERVEGGRRMISGVFRRWQRATDAARANRASQRR